jgi:hypothetical protein
MLMDDLANKIGVDDNKMAIAYSLYHLTINSVYYMEMSNEKYLGFTASLYLKDCSIDTNEIICITILTSQP